MSEYKRNRFATTEQKDPNVELLEAWDLINKHCAKIKKSLGAANCSNKTCVLHTSDCVLLKNHKCSKIEYKGKVYG